MKATDLIHGFIGNSNGGAHVNAYCIPCNGLSMSETCWASGFNFSI